MLQGSPCHKIFINQCQNQNNEKGKWWDNGEKVYRKYFKWFPFNDSRVGCTTFNLLISKVLMLHCKEISSLLTVAYSWGNIFEEGSMDATYLVHDNLLSVLIHLKFKSGISCLKWKHWFIVWRFLTTPNQLETKQHCDKWLSHYSQKEGHQLEQSCLALSKSHDLKSLGLVPNDKTITTSTRSEVIVLTYNLQNIILFNLW